MGLQSCRHSSDAQFARSSLILGRYDGQFLCTETIEQPLFSVLNLLMGKEIVQEIGRGRAMSSRNLLRRELNNRGKRTFSVAPHHRCSRNGSFVMEIVDELFSAQRIQ